VSVSAKTSACVDCATTIIGERLRCPACHADHADAVARAPLSAREGARKSLLSWVVLFEVLTMLICGLALATKGCSP